MENLGRQGRGAGEGETIEGVEQGESKKAIYQYVRAASYWDTLRAKSFWPRSLERNGTEAAPPSTCRAGDQGAS
jgi:hypothetical protein